MRITVIGKGRVGSVLGRRLAVAGHEVTFGIRDPSASEIADLLDGASGARALDVAKSVEGAEVVLLAVPFGAIDDVIAKTGPLEGRIVVDPTNPLKADFSGLTTQPGTSAGEAIARRLPDARVVKAFNCTGSGNMEDPAYVGTPATMFVAGDEDDAKAVVMHLAVELGFDAVDAGPLSMSRELEALALFWVRLAFERGLGPDIAIRLLRR